MPVKTTRNFNNITHGFESRVLLSSNDSAKSYKKKALIFLGLILFFILGYVFLTNPEISAFISPQVGTLKSSNGRTNILILGTAGGMHAGEDLTDTMILASVSLDKPKVSLISIPRDIWIPELKTKINSTFHYGGFPMAESAVEEVLGTPVNYYVMINFSGFKDIVDVLGGIQVNADNGFTDKMYPIEGLENDTCGGHDPLFSCRYETITFNAGPQTMDGATALKFVRSRHAEGDEGTDIAREARQQKVIDAIKNKVLAPNTFLNPGKDIMIWNVFLSNVKTDIGQKEGAVLARKILNARSSIQRFLIPETLLINPPATALYDKQYVFTPKLGNGKWDDIKNWAAQILEGPLSPGK